MLVSPGGYAVPTPNASLGFYREIFGQKGGAKQGSIQGYEVDFMIDNFLNQYMFREVLGAAEGWLGGMHGAAQESGMSIQYCMALPSDLLASMAYPHVTNYRASDDYAGSSVTNFNIQTSSLLGWAVGLRPSKDVFFSTNNEPSNPYMRRLRPKHRTVPGTDLELNALIATLSTGPVAIGDGPYQSNRSLIMRSCRDDGLLLQPDKPPTAIDAQFDGRPPPQGGFVEAGGAQVWSTFSKVGPAESSSSAVAAATGVITHHLLSIDVNNSFWIDTSRDLYPGFDNSSSSSSSSSPAPVALYLWAHELSRCANGSLAVASGCTLGPQLPALDDSRRVLFHATDSHRWSLLHIMPVLPNGWVFLGELSKWVPTSGARFTGTDATSKTGLKVSLKCAVAEVVEVSVLKPTTKREWGADESGGVTAATSADEWLVETVHVACPSGGTTSVCIGSC